MRMRAIVIGVLGLVVAAGDALAAEHKGIRFWNLTTQTQTEVSLAPAGTGNFGPNQCLNDKDKSVDHDERLSIVGIAPGRYDIRLRDAKGRVCYARDIAIKADAVFSLRDNDLKDCSP